MEIFPQTEWFNHSASQMNHRYIFIIIKHCDLVIKPARFMLSNRSDRFSKPIPLGWRTRCMQESLISLLIALVSALLIVVSFVIYIGFWFKILRIPITLLTEGVRWTRILRIETRPGLSMKQPLWSRIILRVIITKVGCTITAEAECILNQTLHPK